MILPISHENSDPFEPLSGAFNLKTFHRGPTIMIGNSIFIVSGNENPYAIQRFDFEGDHLISQRVIGYATETTMPVVFEAPADYCV